MELEKSQLYMAVQQSMDGVAVTDMDGNVQYANLAWALMHGYYGSEVKDKKIGDFLGASTTHTADDVLQVLREQGCYKGEHMNVKKGGGLFPVLVSANIARDDIGEPLGIVFLLRDIVEIKKFQNDLKRSKDNFYKIVNLVTSGIVIVDKEGIVLFVNPAASRMFAKEMDEMLDGHFGIPLVDGEMTEIQIIRGDGKHGIAEMRVVPTEWDNESAQLVLINDVTELRRVQEALGKLEVSSSGKPKRDA